MKSIQIIFLFTLTLYLAMLNARADETGVVTVYKSPTCGCCSKWVEHMRSNGFEVETKDMSDMDPVKNHYGIPTSFQSCHTAVVDGYLIEGHVPAADIKRLLAEKPDSIGLFVPGMPMGSPGMEGPRKDDYSVLSVDKAGKTSVFARH
ncbi:MAG: DUF411 domain-containing protein [Gammaproteobacteria bacterium]